MTVGMLREKLGLDCIAGAEGLDRECTGCFIGDLLSLAICRAERGSVWITVMGNINAVAVAARANVSCVILCESACLEGDAGNRAEEYAIPVLACEKPAFDLAIELHRLLTGAR